MRYSRSRRVAEGRLRSRLGEIRKPTLVVHGSKDPTVAPAEGAALAAAIAGAKHVEIPGGGHYLYRERPDAVHSAIDSFLQGLRVSLRGKTAVVGVYEHPTRFAPHMTQYQIMAEAARGALEDAGLIDRRRRRALHRGRRADRRDRARQPPEPAARLSRLDQSRRLVVRRARHARRGGDRRRAL